MKWEMVKLGELCDVKTGKFDVNHSDENGKYPFFTCAYEPFKCNTYSFEGELILLPGNGANVGEAFYFSGKAEAYQRTYVLSNFKGDTKFLYYFFKGNWKQKLSNKQYGSATNYIRLDNITDFQIPLPPLATQRRIAEILDKADALRQKDQALLQKYDELAQAVFVDMFGDPVRNEKGWEVRKLGELLLPREKITYGVVQPGDEYPNGVSIVRVGDFKSLKIDKSKLKKINPEIEKKHSKTRLKGDEILIACVGSIGKIALADETLKGFNIVRATAKVRVDNFKINRTYLAMQLTQRSIQDYFISETRTSSQPTLNIKQIEETNILVPPLRLQEKFESISIKLLNQIDIIENNHSTSLFQSLLKKAFTGELVE